MEHTKIFEKDARVAFIGDSITHNGLYVEYIQHYYASHLPDRRVRVYNLGIGGDAAAHSLGRIEDMLSVEPTEVVVTFCGNDLGLAHYGQSPSDEDLAKRAERRRAHTEGMVRLVERLLSHGLPVTLCSAIGRDEYTPGTEGICSYGATDALREMYECDLAALVGRLKNTVDYLCPIMSLQEALVASGRGTLFRVDRSHVNDLGQAIMARIFLRAQGLPVAVPTVSDLLLGWQEQPLPEGLHRRRNAGLRWRDLAWVYPHQKDRTPDMTLAERLAFWRQELTRGDLPPYFVKMYTNYVENAEKEPEYVAEYHALSEALYATSSEDSAAAREVLRI